MWQNVHRWGRGFVVFFLELDCTLNWLGRLGNVQEPVEKPRLYVIKSQSHLPSKKEPLSSCQKSGWAEVCSGGRTELLCWRKWEGGLGLAAKRMRGEKEEGKDEKDPSQNLKLRGFLQITCNVTCFILIMQHLDLPDFCFISSNKCHVWVRFIWWWYFVLAWLDFCCCFPWN